MRSDKKGYIVVETIGSFILFILLVISILSLVNIVTVQARMHYALTQAAETASMYSYVLNMTKMDRDLMQMAENADNAEERVTKFGSDVTNLVNAVKSVDFNTARDSANSVIAAVKDAAADPMQILKDLSNYTLDTAANVAFGQLVKKLVKRYLANGEMSGDDYLAVNNILLNENDFELFNFRIPLGNSVDTLNPDGSEFLNADGDIRIKMTYEIKYKFGALELPFDTLKVTQEALTHAWLGGNGKGYEG